jgi:hypothetical protein
MSILCNYFLFPKVRTLLFCKVPRLRLFILSVRAVCRWRWVWSMGGMILAGIILSRVHLKCDGTRWRTGGEVKGKLANGVGSHYSYTTSEHGASSSTTADAHTSAASSRLNWRPCRFKWTRPFCRKTKPGFCACAITFQTQSTQRETCSSATLSAAYLTWTRSGSNQARRGERQATSRQSQGTAFEDCEGMLRSP